jgi:hypothetical protein
MRILTYPLLFVSAIGFSLSLIAHILALLGKPIPGCVWVLHAAIFVVWIPAILICNRAPRAVDRKNQWDAILRDCPVWMRRAVSILFVYAIVNFTLFMASTMGQPKPKGTAPPAVIRGFSGHWMIFYGGAFVVYYSVSRKRSLPDRRNANNDFPTDYL